MCDTTDLIYKIISAALASSAEIDILTLAKNCYKLSREGNENDEKGEAYLTFDVIVWYGNLGVKGKITVAKQKLSFQVPFL